MAMQTGMGLSKIIILAGAGCTGSVLIKNGKMSELIGGLQSYVKGLENSVGDGKNSNSDFSAVATQVRKLATEVRQLASARSVAVVDINSSFHINGSTRSSLLLQAAALCTLGYGFFWWKGYKFSNLMYVTKHNMENAVSTLGKHLEQLSGALAATKKHLTQRIDSLSGKLDNQTEISKLIQNEVTDVHGGISQIGCDLEALQRMVSGLDGKMCTLEDKQDLANVGVLYLCDLVDRRRANMPEILQANLRTSNRPRTFLGPSGRQSLLGLKEIADSLASGSTVIDSVMPDDIDELDDQPGSSPRGVLASMLLKGWWC